MKPEWLIEQTGAESWEVSRLGRSKLVDAYRDEALSFVKRRLKLGEKAVLRDENGYEVWIDG